MIYHDITKLRFIHIFIILRKPAKRRTQSRDDVGGWKKISHSGKSEKEQRKYGVCNKFDQPVTAEFDCHIIEFVEFTQIRFPLSNISKQNTADIPLINVFACQRTAKLLA